MEGGDEKKEGNGGIPWWREVFDDFILLLFLGVTVYAVLYLIWGVMELATLTPFPVELKQKILEFVERAPLSPFRYLSF